MGAGTDAIDRLERSLYRNLGADGLLQALEAYFGYGELGDALVSIARDLDEPSLEEEIKAVEEY